MVMPGRINPLGGGRRPQRASPQCGRVHAPFGQDLAIGATKFALELADFSL